MSALRIVFAGTPEFGLPCLEALVSSRHEVVAVYTQPDRPAGRGRRLQASAVKAWAVAHDLPVYQPVNFKDDDSVETLRALQADVMVVIAYGLILPRRVLAVPKLGCVNVHASLLPRWRGASPIQHVLLHGDERSGVTIMQMDAGMDTGDSLCEVSCTLDPHETAGTLHDRLAAISAGPLLQTLDDLANGCAKPQPQDSTLATYAGKITKEQAQIDWSLPAAAIDRLIRAFNPWPIAYTHAGDEVLRIHEARIEAAKHHAQPGTVLAIDKQGLLVAAGDQALRVQRIQFPGGKVLSVADWLNARRDNLHPDMVLQ
ncbi:methionyl-tRNA formyltransferase [Legionella sp. CNM-4043-24]|uniref:methionyl-tRNA formyltransferase n=1 Tax=Legionella sp. CNM-4043-24 TaxID=3421646 RepID=UPI00403A892F